MSQILSRNIDEKKHIDIVINNLEQNNIQQVLESNSFYLKKSAYGVDYKIAGYRDIELLEMGILKYLILEFESLENNVENISNLTGVDKIFLTKPLDELMKLKLVLKDSEVLSITEEGKKIFKEKRIPVPSRNNTLEFLYDKYTNKYTVYNNDLNDSVIQEEEQKILDLNFLKKLYDSEEVLPQITADIIQDISEDNLLKKMMKKRLEEIRDISEPKYILEYWNRYELFYVYDYLESKIFLRVWDYTQKKFVDEVLEILKEKADYSIDKKLEEYVNDRYLSQPKINKVEKKYSENLKEVVEKTSKRKVDKKDYDKLLIKQIRNENIKPEFKAMLNQTKKLIIISTPWISESVVNDEMFNQFKAILKRGGKIVISWGYAESIEQESKFPSLALLDKLSGLKSPDGSDGLLLVWIGNKHNKEIIVDCKIHLLGSFNWLSYKGEYNIRGESIYKVEDEDLVLEATEFLEKSILEVVPVDIKKFDILIRFKNQEFVYNFYKQNINYFIKNNFKELSQFVLRNVVRNKDFGKYLKIYFESLNLDKNSDDIQFIKPIVVKILEKKNQELKSYIPDYLLDESHLFKVEPIKKPLNVNKKKEKR